MDEEDDVNWEDEDGQSEDGGDEGDGVVVEEPINITIHANGKGESAPAVANKKKSTLKRANFSDEDYQQCLLCHQDDLESQISLSRTVALASSASRLQSVVLAELPADIANTSQGFTQLVELVKWINRTYRLIPHDSITLEEGRDGSNDWDLEKCVLKNKAGSSNQLCQVFAALLIALGYTVRTVRTIDPVSFSPHDHAEVYEKGWRAANPEAPSSSFKPRKTASAPIVHTWLEVRISTGTNRTHNNTVQHQSESGSKTQAVKSCSSSISQGVIDLTDSGDECTTSCPPAVSTSYSVPYNGKNRNSGSSDTGSRWVPVDVVHRCIDQPHHIEEAVRKNKPLQYVLAFECVPTSGVDRSNHSSSRSGTSSSSYGDSSATSTCMKVVDVTNTYKLRHHYSTNRDKQTKAEVDVWLAGLLQALNEGIVVQEHAGGETQAHTWRSPSSASQDYSQVVDLTDDIVWDVDAPSSAEACTSSAPSSSASKKARSSDLDLGGRSPAPGGGDLSVKYPMPERLNDFKDHPVYLLSRHLLSEQALHPSVYAVGVFRGESVYLQVHKETLRSRLQWRRLLKQVRRDEEPIKVIQRRLRNLEADGTGEGYAHSGDIGAGGGEGGASKMVEIRLFGSWQTEPIQIEPVRDGILPVNEYGNIEVWEGNVKFVPAGAVFIDNPAVLKSAKLLDLPCVPAVVGFERKGLQNVPIIGGVVVLKQHSSILKDASFFVEAVKEETHYMKKEKEMISKWERLAHGMLSRQTLREKYGH